MDVLSRIRDVAEPLARAEGVDLLGLTLSREGGRQVLRVTIDRVPGPTALHDCETVSRVLGRALDNLDLIRDHYTLEVSSAGLDRPLISLADYSRTLGHLVRVVPRGGRPGPLVGVLERADDSGLAIRLDDGTTATLALDEVSSARLEVDFGRMATKPGGKR
jgi:ribosome maturation factor RimP